MQIFMAKEKVGGGTWNNSSQIIIMSRVFFGAGTVSLIKTEVWKEKTTVIYALDSGTSGAGDAGRNEHYCGQSPLPMGAPVGLRISIRKWSHSNACSPVDVGYPCRNFEEKRRIQPNADI